MSVSVVEYLASTVSTGSKTLTPTWQTDDYVVVIGHVEAGNNSFATPTATGLTFTRAQISDGSGNVNEAETTTWIALAGSSSSATVSFSSHPSVNWKMETLVIRGSDAYTAGSNHDHTESAKSLTVGTGDGVLYILTDWNAASTNREGTTGSGTLTEHLDDRTVGSMRYGIWSWMNTSSGTFSFGILGYSGIKAAINHVVFTATASGSAVSGTAAGSFGFTGTATGYPGEAGTAAGSFGFTGTAAGGVGHPGVAVGSFGFAGTVAGDVAHTGTAAGSFGFTGVVTGVRGRPGTAVGTFGFTGTASGGKEVSGSAAGTFGFTGTVSGVPSKAGTAAGLFGFTGAATGDVAHTGTAAGSFGFAGTAVGQRAVSGAAAGTFGFTGTASGTVESGVQGTASGAFGFTGTVSGSTSSPHVIGSPKAAAITASRSPSLTFDEAPLEGDIVMMFPSSVGVGVAITVPSGWENPLTGNTDVETDAHEMCAVAHVVTAGEAAGSTVTFTVTNLYDVAQTGNVVGCVVRNADIGDIFAGAASTFSSGNGATPHVLSAVTPDDNNGLILSCVTRDGTSGTGYTSEPAGWSFLVTTQLNHDKALLRRTLLSESGVATSATNITPAGSDEYASITVVIKGNAPEDITGTGAGVFGFAGTVAGVVGKTGTAVGSLGFAGAVAGTVGHTGVAAGALGFAGTAAGVAGRSGTAAGDFGFAGSASGTVVGNVTGTAVGTFGFTGEATGRTGDIVTGVASGTFGFTGHTMGIITAPPLTWLRGRARTGESRGTPSVSSDGATWLRQRARGGRRPGRRP
jgi:hypothetical protein